MNIQDIKLRIYELSEEKALMENLLKEEIINIIYEVAKSDHDHNMRKISKNISIISYSHMIGSSWSSIFHSWEKQADDLLNYLANTPIIGWKKKLTDMLDTKGNVEIKKRGYIWPGVTGIVDRIPIDREFVEKIIERI